MARILIVDFGSGGFSADLAGEITATYPQHHVEVTEPTNASHLVSREPWDVIVVNAANRRDEAIDMTMRIPGTLEDPLSSEAKAVLFLTDNPPNNGINVYDSDVWESYARATKAFVSHPWQFERRKYAMRGVDIALNPAYRQKKGIG